MFCCLFVVYIYDHVELPVILFGILHAVQMKRSSACRVIVEVLVLGLLVVVYKIPYSSSKKPQRKSSSAGIGVVPRTINSTAVHRHEESAPGVPAWLDSRFRELDILRLRGLSFTCFTREENERRTWAERRTKDVRGPRLVCFTAVVGEQVDD